MYRSKYLLLALLFTIVASTSGQEFLSDRINTFGIKALQLSIKKNHNENILINPVSVFSVATLLFHGLSEQEKEKLSSRVGFNWDNETLGKNRATRILDSQIRSEAIQNLTANSIWYQKGLKIKKSYKDKLLEMECESDSLDFLNQAESEGKINLWVSRKTNNKILDFFKNDLPTSTQVVLINASYFKGLWNREFDVSKTMIKTFYNDNQTKIAYMHNEGDFSYYLNKHYESIRVPFKDKRFSFIIYLPAHNSSLIELVSQLNEKALLEPLNNLSEEHFSSLEIPKFTLNYRGDLLDILINSGLSGVFNHNVSFTEIAESGNLRLDKIVHKTFFDINEQGTEATGATGAVLRKSSNSFKANRPFLFAVFDEKLKMIHFLGILQNP